MSEYNVTTLMALSLFLNAHNTVPNVVFLLEY